jgi:hypothetical protein
VPEITPVEALKVSPGGRVPEERLSVIGFVPGARTRFMAYGTPTVPPSGKPVSVGSGFTVIVVVAEFIVPDTIAVTVNDIGTVTPVGAV